MPCAKVLSIYHTRVVYLIVCLTSFIQFFVVVDLIEFKHRLSM